MVERLLTNISRYLSKYEMTAANQDIAENIDNISAISFACLVLANLYYGLFDELLEGLSLFLPSDNPEDCAIGTYYGRYYEFIAGFFITSDGIIHENTSDLDDKDDKGVGNDDDGGEKDDDWGEGDDRDKKDSDSRVEKEDSWKKGTSAK